MRLVNSNLVRSNAGHASEKHTYRKQSEWRFLACAVSSVGLGPIDGSVRAFHRNQSEMRAQCYLKTSFRTTDIQVTNSRPPTEHQEPLLASTPARHSPTGRRARRVCRIRRSSRCWRRFRASQGEPPRRLCRGQSRAWSDHVDPVIQI